LFWVSIKKNQRFGNERPPPPPPQSQMVSVAEKMVPSLQ
jgi:hypothetical protein